MIIVLYNPKNCLNSCRIPYLHKKKKLRNNKINKPSKILNHKIKLTGETGLSV